jgi:hypothetical protein
MKRVADEMKKKVSELEQRKPDLKEVGAGQSQSSGSAPLSTASAPSTQIGTSQSVSEDNRIWAGNHPHNIHLKQALAGHIDDDDAMMLRQVLAGKITPMFYRLLKSLGTVDDSDCKFSPIARWQSDVTRSANNLLLKVIK